MQEADDSYKPRLLASCYKHIRVLVPCCYRCVPREEEITCRRRNKILGSKPEIGRTPSHTFGLGYGTKTRPVGGQIFHAQVGHNLAGWRSDTSVLVRTVIGESFGRS